LTNLRQVFGHLTRKSDCPCGTDAYQIVQHMIAGRDDLFETCVYDVEAFMCEFHGLVSIKLGKMCETKKFVLMQQSDKKFITSLDKIKNELSP